MSAIAEGDDVLLYLDKKRTYMVRVEADKQFHTHKGFIELGDLIGRPFGSPVVSSLGVEFYALRPFIRDRILKTDRRTQVLYPKDIGYLLIQLDVGSGSRVVEAGTGSGALTMALANAVRPDGMLYTYEINPTFQRVAAGNIERAGLADYVELKGGRRHPRPCHPMGRGSVGIRGPGRRRGLRLLQPDHRAGDEDGLRDQGTSLHSRRDGRADPEEHHGGGEQDPPPDPDDRPLGLHHLGPESP